jgi:Icc-related predicted phosphoesterase
LGDPGKMKLLIFSDVHGDLAALSRLMDTEADYYFAAGDLCNFGQGLERCGEILARCAKKVYVLPGNHESAAHTAALSRRFGLHHFHEKSFQAGKWWLAGLGYSNPTPFNTPGEYTEAELARKLAPFSKLSPLVLICHAPPYGTPLDRIRDGLHAGSKSVRDFIERCQPAHFLCGHIHEAGGVSAHLGQTAAVNVGRSGYLLELN